MLLLLPIRPRPEGKFSSPDDVDYKHTNNTSRKQNDNTALPSLSLVSTNASPAITGAGGDDICSAPTTVTITPTVYVTAGAVGVNATFCDARTLTATVTNTATVTVSAGSHLARHKRHSHRY